MWTEGELAHKAADAARASYDKPAGHLLEGPGGSHEPRELPSFHAEPKSSRSREPAPAARKPEFALQVFRKFVVGFEGVNAEWLVEKSPICPWNRTPASFLHALYRKGEKVIIFDDFRSQGQAVWTHPGLPYDARNLNHFVRGNRLGVWFLCNPVDGAFRPNDAGEPSRRSAHNVTSWRYMVVESDRTDIEACDWLKALVQLPLPIAAIYETGGRLPHALLRVDAPTKQAWDNVRDQLKPALVMLGADPGSLSAVRLTRLPCCERLGRQDERGVYYPFKDGARLQRLLYLNPEPDSTPIVPKIEAWTL